MGIKYADMVREITTGTGVGPTFFLEGPVSNKGYRGFVAEVGNGQQCVVRIMDHERGEWAIYLARVISGVPNDSLDCHTLSSSSNNDQSVNFQPGEKEVDCILAAEDLALISETSRMLTFGGNLIYKSATGFDIESGAAAIDGFRISWPALTGPGPGGYTPDTMLYVYIEDDNGDGTAAYEVSAVLPQYDDVRLYWTKGVDFTRRLIGAVAIRSDGTIAPFKSEKVQGIITLKYDYPTTEAILLAGSIPLTWTELTALSQYVPTGAISWSPRVSLSFPTQNDTAKIGLDHILDAGKGIDDAESILSDNAARNADIRPHDLGDLFVDRELPATYIIGEQVGTPTIQISVRGWTAIV